MRTIQSISSSPNGETAHEIIKFSSSLDLIGKFIDLKENLNAASHPNVSSEITHSKSIQNLDDDEEVKRDSLSWPKIF